MPASTFLHRIFYETLVAFITLSTFPLIVAIVAPIAIFARISSFVVREFRMVVTRRKISSNTNSVASFLMKKETSAAATNNLSEREKILSSLPSGGSSSSNNHILNNSNSSIRHDNMTTTMSQPNSSDCVVIVNAASSFEAEGLVRYYAARGCTVIACDKNQQQLIEIFRNEDQELVKPCSLTSPESVSRVRDLVSQFCSSQYRRDPLRLYAIVFVEPSGEVVLRRAMEREFFLGNNDFKKFFPGMLPDQSVNSSSNSNKKTVAPPSASSSSYKRGTTTATTPASSSTTTMSMNFSSSEVVFLLAEYLSHASGGETPDFYQQLLQSNKNKAASNSKNNKDDQNHHRRTSSLDAASFAHHHHHIGKKSSTASKSFAHASSRTLSENAIESFVFTPMRTQTALLRELVPIALRSMNLGSHHHRSSSFNNSANDNKGATEEKSADHHNHHHHNNSRSHQNQLEQQQQPRVCIMTRSDEDEELATTLALLNYSSSVSLASLLSSEHGTTASSSSSNHTSSSSTAASSSSGIQPVTARIASTSVSTFAGLGKMRRMLSESLLNVCDEIRRQQEEASHQGSHHSKKQNSSGNKNTNFVRACHIELFTTRAQLSAQQRWKQSLMQFYFSYSSYRTAITRNRWRVPRVPFSLDPYFGYFDENNNSIGGDDSNNNTDRLPLNDSSSRNNLASSSSASPSPRRNQQHQQQFQKSKQQIDQERQDLINCSYQISFLGETINTPKPKRASYASPRLSLNEPYYYQNESLTATLQRLVIDGEDGQGDGAGAAAASSSINSNSNKSSSDESALTEDPSMEKPRFVPLSFWTRAISWSLREERVLDVMLAGFHSSTKIERVIRNAFEYFCG